MNKYPSPTTPGLDVTFNNYLIELICLNMDPKLKPRFWKEQRYWKAKYGREVKGVFNLLKRFDDVNDSLLKRTMMDIIQKLRIKSLCAKKTVDRVERSIKIRYKNILVERKLQSPKIISNISFDKNARFIDTNRTTKLGKIREIQSGKETD